MSQVNHNRPADIAATLGAALDRLAGDFSSLGLAVSGGGDSVALMNIAAKWAAGRRIMVATVDHGLRSESAAEAQQVHRAAKKLGLDHTTLLWRHDTDAGNLMANARDARLRLLSGWAVRNGLPAIALGHTADDQAETFLLRLLRGAGIDGLSGMSESREAFGVRWLRPMLAIHRADLRGWLIDNDIDWIDDPTNDNDDFDRIKIRKAMEVLDISTRSITDSANNIREAKDALTYYSAYAARDVIVRNGAIMLPRRPFRDAPTEICRRLLVAGCRWITGSDYPPRRATVLHALRAVSAGRRVTLDGALVEPGGEHVRLIREPAAAMRAEISTGAIWDQRWMVTGLANGEHVTAVGYEPLSLLNWRSAGLTRDEAAASPGIWKDARLLAAPLIRASAAYQLRPVRAAKDFRRIVMAH